MVVIRQILLLKEEAEKRLFEKLANYMFTFDDSLNAGNCRPGTQNFKNLVEREVGHEVNEISLADLRKYGKKFNCSNGNVKKAFT